jgi:hypothetical protein
LVAKDRHQLTVAVHVKIAWKTTIEITTEAIDFLERRKSRLSELAGGGRTYDEETYGQNRLNCALKRRPFFAEYH